MKLTDLDSRWFAEGDRHGQGVSFLCPKCRGGLFGGSRVAVAFTNRSTAVPRRPASPGTANGQAS